MNNINPTKLEQQDATPSLAQMCMQKNTRNGKLFIRNTAHTHALPGVLKRETAIPKNKSRPQIITN